MLQGWRYWIAWAGLDGGAPVSHGEKLISGLGGFLGLLAVLAASSLVLDAQGITWVLASMGASAVLLFAVPHGALSQPWAVVGGHVISAIVGVACVKLLAPGLLVAALAVGLAIGAMYYLRCIHPPGGATALIAVVGGESVHTLGWQFVVTPVLLNALLIVMAAVLVNAPFPWRRYPAALTRLRSAQEPQRESGVTSVDHADLAWALRQINSYVDVTEQDLARLISLATSHARAQHLSADEIVLGGCYSNGQFGDEWQVRKVVDEGGHRHTAGDRVIYRVVAGTQRGSSGICTRDELARWARYRVERNDSSWQRLDNVVPIALAAQEQ